MTSKIQIPADISSDTEQLTNMMQGIDDQEGAQGDCSGVSLPKQAIVVESSINSKASTCHDEVVTDRGRFPRTLGELDGFITMCQANRASIRHFDELAAPLVAILNGDVDFEWTGSTRSAFNRFVLKLNLSGLVHP